MTEQYTGHGENTGGLQLHSVGDIYPMILVYYPAAEKFAVLNGSTGVTSECRHSTAGGATIEAMRLNGVSEETIAKCVALRCLLTINMKLVNGDLPKRKIGLCMQLAIAAQDAYGITTASCMHITLRAVSSELMQSWHEFSGSKTHPVPHEKDEYMVAAFDGMLEGSADDPASRAAAAYYRYKDVYDTATKYGKARRRLLQYMIDSLRFELKYDQ